MIRILDFAFASIGLLVLSPVLLLVIVIGWFDTGSPIFRQPRVGRNKRTFTLYKFRTMRIDTPDLPSHVADPNAITPLGRILRVTKLDELLQLVNVWRGEMSLVGPRPNLLDQHELIAERDKLAVYSVLPGITGLAQINGIDMSTPQLLAETDRRMIDEMSIGRYFLYIFQTVAGKGRGDAMRKHA